MKVSKRFEKILALSLCSSWAVTAMALAGDQGPAATAAAAATTAYDVPAATESDILTNELKPGNIKVKNGKTEIQTHYVHASSGFQGAGLRLDASKKFIVGGEASRDSVSAFGLLKPGINGRLEVTQDKAGANRVHADIAVTGASLGYFQMIARRESEKHYRERTAAEAKLGVLQRRIESLEYRSRDLRDCQAGTSTYCGLYRELVAKGPQAVNAELARLSSERDAAVTERDALQSEHRKRFLRPGTNDTRDLTHFTADLNLVSVSGVYRRVDDIGVKQAGARLAAGEASLHAAGLIGDLPVDVCASIVPLAIIAGFDQGRKYSEFEASVCGGVSLGKLGHLSNELTFRGDYGKYWRVTDTTTLKDIGGSPVGVTYSYEEEQAKDGTSVRRNLVGVRAAC